MPVQRKSNIELLRIIVMYMILLLHANILCFGTPHRIDPHYYFREGAISLTIIAVNVFVLITGYFGTSFRLSKIANLCFQVLFAVVPVSLLLMAFDLFEFHTLKEFAHGFRFWDYWFVNAYIGLVVLSPVLNMAVKHLSRKQFKVVLIALFVLFSILNSGYLITPPGLHLIGGYSTIWFFFLYLLGRYIAVYSIDRNLSWWQVIAIYVVGAVGTFICLCKLRLGTYNSPFVTLQAVGFFLLFTKFSFSNKVVNFVASSALMVFLLHCHPLLVDYYIASIERLFVAYGDTPKYILMTLGFCLMVFLIAVAYDQLRKLLWSLIEPAFKKLDKRIEE